jgi:hypothetical protein
MLGVFSFPAGRNRWLICPIGELVEGGGTMRLSRKPSAIRRRRAFVAVVLLLAAGADTTAVDTYGLTAYALAVEHEETAVIAVMQAYHPHIDSRECIFVSRR